ncbi:MAG: hypothetical protein V1718_06165, partial [archaeon]
GGYVYEASYDPENIGIYNYTIFANDTSGAYSYSGYNTFRSEGYPPEINSVSHSPHLVMPGDFINFAADVTDKRNDLDTVFLKIVSPVTVDIKMTNITQSTYVANYTTPLTPKGIFYYIIWANDTEGFVTTSGYQAFISNDFEFDNATISVKISPSCCGMFSFFYVPERVMQNQTLILLSIFENCGNIGINETTNITIQKNVIDEYGLINESTLVIIPPDIIRYWKGDAEYVMSLDDEAFFSIFYTTGLPLGNYTANTSAFYAANESFDNQTYSCQDVIGISKQFEIVKEFGTGKISPVVIIREMPPHIIQDTDNCDADDPWGGSCTYTSVKLIVYNRGTEPANSLVLNDIGTDSCGGGNCSAIAYRCVNNSYNYTCETITNSSAMSYVNFSLNGTLNPNEYVILEYEIVPTNNSLFYNLTKSNKYVFNAEANYLYGADNEPYTAKEDHERYNPPEANTIYLLNKSSFNYNLDIDTDTEKEERDFEINKEITFYVKGIALSGSGLVNGSWYAKITIPTFWNVTSCDYVSGAACSCSYNNTEKWVACNGSSNIGNMATTEFKFTAITQIQSDFLLPVYSNDSTAGRFMDEYYIPGLFALAKSMKELETPTPNPTPTPEPRPEPVLVPEPEPEPTPKVEILLIPINTSYKALQGQTIPTYFWVENIGQGAVENISIEPVLMPGWNYSETLVDFLNVSEKVNRTMFITPPEDATPGMYAIPVRARVGNETADIAYIWIEVLFGKHLAIIRIIEAPEVIEVDELTNITIPILVENIGSKVLHNVSVRIENAERCLSEWKANEIMLNLTEINSIEIRASTKEGPNSCRTNLIVYSIEGAYAFTPLKIIVKPKPAQIPLEKRITPWLALLWTLLFVIYAIYRKKKTRHGELPSSNRPRMILYLLLLGEGVILVYVFLWYFGIIEII